MIRALLIWLALALPGVAQDLPDWQHTSINDFAGLLTPQDTKALDQALIALHDQTGIEGTVVTLQNRAAYGGQDGLEAFATRLFNHWGVGDRIRNDGFMLLVLADDREARIELGAGYPSDDNKVARDIMDSLMLPEFRAGQMSDGVREGTLAVIERIARPSAAGQAIAPPARNLVDRLVPVAVFSFFGFMVFQIARKFVEKFRHGRRPCPNCGGRGLVEEVAPILATDATGTPLERQSVWTRCPTCGWKSPRSTRDKPRRHAPRSRGFGGGRSSGGGASGGW